MNRGGRKFRTVPTQAQADKGVSAVTDMKI